MKRILYLLALVVVASACNNDSDKSATMPADTVNTAPVNDAISNPNRVPGSNTPGEAMGNGDTSSYERMPQKIDSGR